MPTRTLTLSVVAAVAILRLHNPFHQSFSVPPARPRHMTSGKNMRAVIFDLDDTLWDCMATLLRAHERWLDFVRGVDPESPLLNRHADFKSWWPLMKELREERPELANDMSSMRKQAIARSCAQLGIDAEPIVEPSFSAWFAGRNDPVFFDGALDVLRKLKAAGFVCGALTDGNSDPLSIPSLAPLLDFSVSAMEAGASKPDPRPFMLALEQAGCSADEAVYVGDNYAKDVVGAKAVGMKAIWLVQANDANNKLTPEGDLAADDTLFDAKVTDIKDVTTLIVGWAGVHRL